MRSLLAVALLRCFVVAVGVVTAIPTVVDGVVLAEAAVLVAVAAIAFDSATDGGAVLAVIHVVLAETHVVLADILAAVLAVGPPVDDVAVGGLEADVDREFPVSVVESKPGAVVVSQGSMSAVADGIVAEYP